MAKMRSDNQLKNCPSCGAQVVSEICAYCGTRTGLNTAEATMEYPVLECKEATLNFWTTWFPMIFAVAFGVPGVILSGIAGLGYENGTLIFVGLPFLLIGSAAAWFTIRTISRYVKVKTQGKMIQGVVYGYMDDHVLINNQPAQIVKVLVQTSQGPRFILYQLGDTVKLYGIDDTINIKVYRNYFMICKSEEVPQW